MFNIDWMKATLTLTPESNIDHDALAVIDMGQVILRTYDWTDAVRITDKLGGDYVENVSRLSLYDHRLILDGVPHRILAMQSRSP